MKRAHPQQPEGAAADPNRMPRPKRPKTSQACTSCRKNKTRCEPSTDPVAPSGRCHRCHVLSVPCSSEGTQPVPTGRLDCTAGGVIPPSAVPGPSSVSQAAPGSMYNRASATQVFERLDRPVTPPLSSKESEIHLLDGITTESIVTCAPSEEASAHIDNLSWVSQPMAAMAELMRNSQGKNKSAGSRDMHTERDVLTDGQITYLCNIFEELYTPWLNIPPIRLDSDSTPTLDNFLTLARCAVACRYLPPAVFARVQPQLQRQAEHAILLHNFDPGRPMASTEAVQALLILATWTPAFGHTPPEVLEPSLVASGAVKMARTLRLDTASERVIALRKKKQEGPLSTREKELYDDAMFEARLWSAACNIEWGYMTGTLRTPTSARSSFDHQTMDWRLFPGAGGVQEVRDFRLGISAQMHEAAFRGLQKRCAALEPFFIQIDEVLTVFAHARNVTTPLRHIYPHERMHMDVLIMKHHFGRLLVLFHGLNEARRFAGAHLQQKDWMVDFETSGVAFIKHWGIECVYAAQEVLNMFFDLVDRHHSNPGDSLTSGPRSLDAPFCTPSPLSAAPDMFFSVVLFAACCTVTARYTMFVQFKLRDSIFLYTVEGNLNRLVRILDTLGVGPEHIANKAATVVRELKRVWHDKVVAPIAAAHVSASGGLGYWPGKNTSALLMEEQRLANERHRHQQRQHRHSQQQKASVTNSATPSSDAAYSPDPTMLRDAYAPGMPTVSLPVSAERGSASTSTPGTSSASLASNSPALSFADGEAPLPGSFDLFGSPHGFVNGLALFDWNIGSAAPLGAPPPVMPDEGGFSTVLDPNLFLDEGFWNLFMNNLGASQLATQ